MKKVLLADDEAPLRYLVRTTLEDPEIEFLEARDGLEALELAVRELPDLILLDWMMPHLSGIEVAEELRRREETASIPIIMLTARGQALDVEKGKSLGVLSYMVKPFSPLELLEKVDSVLA